MFTCEFSRAGRPIRRASASVALSHAGYTTCKAGAQAEAFSKEPALDKGGRRRLRSFELHYWTGAEGCLGAAALRTLLTDLLSHNTISLR
eukprot:6199932-Pleurochrysis_carterae.AAC.1